MKDSTFFKALIIGSLLSVIITFLVYAAVGYVVAHFITKFW
jgi:polyferredoxin